MRLRISVVVLSAAAAIAASSACVALAPLLAEDLPPGVQPEASAPARKASADAETVKLVKFFVGNPPSKLPVERIAAFLDVDPETLPAKLRDPFLARRAELLALKKVSDGKEKGSTMRLAGQDPLPPAACDAPTQMKNPGMLASMGFMEIQAGEASRLSAETKCSECELQQEFSLTLVETPAGGKKAKKRYFLNNADPLTVMVQAWRQGRNAFGTDFFSAGHPSCR